MLNSASAVVVSNQNSVDFINMSNMYRQTVAGGAACYVGGTGTSDKQQLVAADLSAGVALANGANSVASTLVKITASPQAVSTFTIPVVGAGDNITAIILKSPGRWIVGTFYGNLFEIDSSGKVYDETSLSLISPEGGARQSSQLYINTVHNMSYDNNLLLVSTPTGIFLLDWGTKTIIQSKAGIGATSTANAFQICQGASGVTLAGDMASLGSSQSFIREVDYTIKPLTVSGVAVSNGTPGAVVCVSPVSGIGAFISTNREGRAVTITPRDSTTRTIWVQSASSGGTDQKARLTIIDDTAGVNNSFVILDTYMQSPATYRVPTGKTLMEIIKVGNGSTATWDVSRYNT
jgi:hypothetical protein